MDNPNLIVNKQGVMMFAEEDRVVATKGIELGEMVVTGISSGGFYIHVKVDGMTLTYPAQDLKKA